MALLSAHEIYFQSSLSLEALAEKLRGVFNWREENTKGVPQKQFDPGLGRECIIIENLGLRFVLVENKAPIFVEKYNTYQYYLFIRWNLADRQTLNTLYGPLITLMGNALYRAGFEIEVDALLTHLSRNNDNDPLRLVEGNDLFD